MKTKKSIAICIPARGSVPIQFMINLFNIVEEYADKYDLKLCFSTKFGIDHARNELVDMAQKWKADYLWFIDDDMIIKRGMLDALLDMKKDIASGLYFLKPKPNPPCVRMKHPMRKKDEFAWVRVKWLELGKIFAVDGVGFGCILINSKVFDKLKKPYFKFEWFKDDKGEWKTLSEDLYLCKEAAKVGFKVWLNTNIIVPHLGGVVDDSDYAWNLANMLKEEKKVKDDTNFIEYCKEVSEFTGEKLEDVKDKVLHGVELMKNEWNRYKPKTPEEIKKFYKNCKSYLYDLGIWHLTWRKKFDEDLVHWFQDNPQFKKLKILDYGCGIGQNGIMLAKLGGFVTLADLDSYTLNFAEFRAKKKNLTNVKIWRTDIEPVPNEKFEIILCYDVLEHLPLDELKNTVKNLKSLKHKTGKILMTTSFGKSEAHPMHFELDPKRIELIRELDADFRRNIGKENKAE